MNATSNNKTMENKKAPPPARITKANFKRAREMMALIEALPESEQKQALMMSEQVAEWDYHLTQCSVQAYTHKPTEKEKMEGKTITPEGVIVKLRSKGNWCPHCQCSAQEWKRHTKTKKCIANRAKAQPHLRAIEKEGKRRSVYWLDAEADGLMELMLAESHSHQLGPIEDVVIASLLQGGEALPEAEIVIATPIREEPKKKTKKLKLKKKRSLTVTD
tara:strand:+ start:672 stop:1325 length:654 start_codon:yes stop_codon:yes gene_type:complete